jgi:F0F1-type ATP synthase assembly protein I
LQKQNKESKQKEINSAFAKAGPYLNIGYFLMAAMILFGYIGYKIDQWARTGFLFLLCGLFLALGLSFYNMYKVLSQLNNKSK